MYLITHVLYAPGLRQNNSQKIRWASFLCRLLFEISKFISTSIKQSVSQEIVDMKCMRYGILENRAPTTNIDKSRESKPAVIPE